MLQPKGPFMIRGTCEHCDHWKRWQPPATDPNSVQDFGDCRRCSPILHPGPTVVLARTRWPSTLYRDYCGQFKVNPETTI